MVRIKKKTLLIIIIVFIYCLVVMSGTYAYYYFDSSNNATIAGNAATADVDLSVERVVPTGENLSLVPLIDSHLDRALKGEGGVSSCIDGNNNLSCEVYKITISNTGNTNLKLTGTVTLAASGENSIYDNLKWEEIVSPTERKSQYLTNGMGTSILDKNMYLAVGNTNIYYIAVWLSENNLDQRETDKGSFGGLVRFESADGDGVSATFKEFDSDYCTNNGITKLSDCILISERYSDSVEEAKSYISSKVADFTKTAPIITYSEKKESNLTNSNGVISNTNKSYYGTDYTFNSETGTYSLKNASLKSMTEAISNDSVKYYTCNSTDTSSCSSIYVIYSATETTSDGITTYKATKIDRYTQNMVTQNISGKGLYKASDDLGDSYYYRGKVDNNYVSFAGFIWRIVRINGDGSIRLIYSGTSTSDTGSKTSIGTSSFNSDPYDMASLGYKYGLDKVLQHTTSTLTYSNINASYEYYFSTSYTTNDSTKKLSLSGDTVQGTLDNIWKNESNDYKYTCFSTSITETCTTLVEIQSYVNSTKVKAKYHSYLSRSYESTYTDEYDSAIKTKLDNWYRDNLAGTNYEDKIVDNIFCNDRSLYKGDGFTLNQTTYYGTFQRNVDNKTPSLICPRNFDKFTKSSSLGNGELTYPVGLITADEVAYAGGTTSSLNQAFYLYTGQHYWTLSPSYFPSSNTVAYSWAVNSTGILHYGRWASSSNEVRPVINLSSDTNISSGDGTASNPYIIG